MSEKNELKLVAVKMKKLYDSLIEAGFDKHTAIEYMASLITKTALGNVKEKPKEISLIDLLG
jgi:hypothetical protein